MVDGLVRWAELTAARFMPPLGPRWAHVQAVGLLAEQIAPAFGAEAQVLAAGAWLHDIGYSAELSVTGFHPLDGARWVRDAGWPGVADLVAQHSGARREAQLRGLYGFGVEFPWQPGRLHEAVTFCDMTTSPDGHPVAVADRLDEIVERYGSGHVTGRAIAASRDEIEAFCEATRRRVVEAGLTLDAHRMAGSALLR